jgi:hypothetical protein
MQSIRKRTFLKAHGYDIWYSVVTEYNATKKAKTASKKEMKKNNKMTTDLIWEGLPDLVREKVGNCSLAKEILDKLHDIYFYPITESKFAKEDIGTNRKKYAHHVRQIHKKKSVK